MSEAQEEVSFLILTKNQGPRKSVNFILNPQTPSIGPSSLIFELIVKNTKVKIYDQAVKNRFATICVLKTFPHRLVVSAETIKFSFLFSIF